MLRIDTQNADPRKPSTWLATWFGAGFINPAPGTWGSLAAIPYGLLIFYFTDILGLTVATLLITLIGWWAADRYQKETGIHDSKAVVIDEVAGQWLALIPAFYLFGINVIAIVSAFLLFRFFDILKPWPVSFFDKKVDNAIGVMGDDIVAGLYAALIIYGVTYAAFG